MTADGYHGPMDQEGSTKLCWREGHRTMPGARAWKSLDWEAMDRLHSRGFISDPATQDQIGSEELSCHP